jgi:hypothetical protein
MAESEAEIAGLGWWTRLQFCFWVAFGLWARPRVVWLARSLALY